MSQPFIGEVRAWGCNFAPRGWLMCSGGLVPISEFEATFALLGTTYGGDGRSTFGIPNLQGRAPMHAGRGPGLTPVRLGQFGGYSGVTVGPAQMPSHSHSLYAQELT